VSPSPRSSEPPTCARCGQPWREPHRFYPPGDAPPLCSGCFFAPEPHEVIDTLADVVAYRGAR